MLPLTPAMLHVLLALADGDKHGYAIMTDVREFAGVDMGPGTLYGAITRLENKGFIKALSTQDRRRPYRLTALGRQHLKDQLNALEPVLQAGSRRLRHS